MTTAEDTERAKSQAQAQLESIKELVKELENASEGTCDEARQAILEDPLSVEVRSGWHTPGDRSGDEEYMILLCTFAVVAVRIIGSRDPWAEPDSAHIEYHNWGTPWIRLPTSGDDDDALLDYARTFYFGS